MSASRVTLMGSADGLDIHNEKSVIVTSANALKVTLGGESVTTSPSGGSTAITSGSSSSTTSLTTATTGSGTTVDLGTAHTAISAFVLVNGTVSGGTVRLQVSHDGTNWSSFPTDVITGALGTGVNAVLNSPLSAFRYARAQVGTNIAGGGSVTVTIMAAG